MLISHKSPSRSLRANEQRVEKIKAGFIWDDQVFDVDTNSMSLIVSRVMRLTIDADIHSVEWRTKDNAIHLFSRAGFFEFAAAADAYVESLYQVSWQQKQ